ncbi:MAG: DUF4130 domain-containing protein, partial [Candidatus Adiutrix sp.]|nr:DUF4130 domain-containing protein [Candidatus Adiutrix sp.]
KWIIRDLARGFGFYYDTERVRELDFPPCAEGAPDPVNPATGQLEAAALADEEELWQEAWRGYFSAVAIDERANLRLQRQYMPQRFWPYLTEKQNSPPADENFVGKK